MRREIANTTAVSTTYEAYTDIIGHLRGQYILTSFRLRLLLDFECKKEILVTVLNFIYAQKPLTMISTTTTNNHSVDSHETRCECGQLIAKVGGEGLELKCKRCKRIVVIPFSSIEGWGIVES